MESLIKCLEKDVVPKYLPINAYEYITQRLATTYS